MIFALEPGRISLEWDVSDWKESVGEGLEMERFAAAVAAVDAIVELLMGRVQLAAAA